MGATDALITLLTAEGLVVEHPPEVEAEAALLVASPGLDDPELVDLTALPFVTIDEVHSQDLDQAVFIEPEDGGHAVWYALADAAFYVRAGTALYTEALRRGSSFYLPGIVVPMLPKSLSEGIVSLLPDVERRALVFRLTVRDDGRCIGVRLIRGRVRSRQKLAFSHVQAMYDGEAHPIVDPAIVASLEELAVVGKRRMALAEEHAVVRFRRSEIDVSVGPDGLRFVCLEDLRRDVERYNEQISVMCNVEGARFLQEGHPDLVQPIYRVHAPPQPERVAGFVAVIDGLVRTRKMADTWRWDPEKESLAAYLDRLPEDGPDGRVSAAIHRQAVMSAGEASFTGTPGSHHGLGADVYARFTAPMREVVGIFLHEEALEKLAGQAMPVAEGTPNDRTLREAVIIASNRCKDVQKRLDRETNRLILDQLFADALAGDHALAGTVMGLTGPKVHVRLDDPPVDVKVYVGHLEEREGPMFVQPDGAALRRRKDGRSVVKVGDAVEVRVLGPDPGRDRWALSVARVPNP